MKSSGVKTLIFDLDGTLCESTKPVNSEMYEVLNSLLDSYEIWITTGASFERVKHQVPDDLLLGMSGVYCCLGTECYNPQGKIVARFESDFPESLFKALEAVYKECEFPKKNSPAITKRNAMVNFATINRNSSDQLRAEFAAWDNKTQYRKRIIEYLKSQFPEFCFAAGGMVSIDITVKGYDKSTILDNPDVKSDILFFGDRCDKNGNDYPIAEKIMALGIGDYYHVKSPEHTLQMLKKIRG